MIKIREANQNDSKLILSFINRLAEYEKLEKEVTANEELINKWIFEERKAEVIFIVENNIEVGVTLYFYNFSTFLAKPGIYIEDLFVLKEHRSKGYGKLMLKYLAQKAKNMGCGRIEWICLDWNKPSIDFYLSLKAKPLDEWTVFRLNEKAYLDLIEVK